MHHEMEPSRIHANGIEAGKANGMNANTMFATVEIAQEAGLEKAERLVKEIADFLVANTMVSYIHFPGNPFKKESEGGNVYEFCARVEYSVSSIEIVNKKNEMISDLIEQRFGPMMKTRTKISFDKKFHS